MKLNESRRDGTDTKCPLSWVSWATNRVRGTKVTFLVRCKINVAITPQLIGWWWLGHILQNIMSSLKTPFTMTRFSSSKFGQYLWKIKLTMTSHKLVYEIWSQMPQSVTTRKNMQTTVPLIWWRCLPYSGHWWHQARPGKVIQDVNQTLTFPQLTEWDK